LAKLKKPDDLIKHNNVQEPLQSVGQADLPAMDLISPPNNSGLQPVDTIIILDTGHNVEILSRAIEQALGLNEPNTTQTDNGMCFPHYAIAARGAALRARDWISYYEASFPESWEDEESWQGGEYELDFDSDE
jgi:hypothetical protein